MLGIPRLVVIGKRNLLTSSKTSKAARLTPVISQHQPLARWSLLCRNFWINNNHSNSSWTDPNWNHQCLYKVLRHWNRHVKTRFIRILNWLANQMDTDDTCASIENIYDITWAEFYAWNPALGSDCTNLWLEEAYCVSISWFPLLVYCPYFNTILKVFGEVVVVNRPVGAR